MSSCRLGGLQVLVTGIRTLISRDVVHLLVAEGAKVTAADGDEGVLTRLQRDLGLYRTTADFAPIDLFSASEMRLFAANMQGLGRLPHLVVCCCGGDACPAALASSLLQPSLVLHALPCADTGLRRAVAGMRVPSLPDLLERGRRRGVFDPRAWPRRASIAGHLFGLHRGVAPPERPPGGRARSPPSGRAARRGDRRIHAPNQTPPTGPARRRCPQTRGNRMSAAFIEAVPARPGMTTGWAS